MFHVTSEPLKLGGLTFIVFSQPIRLQLWYVLVQVEQVESIAIVGRKQAIIENELVAFIVKSFGSDEQEVVSNIRKRAESELEIWEQPMEYRIIESIPRTTIGKIDYKKLEKLLDEEIE